MKKSLISLLVALGMLLVLAVTSQAALSTPTVTQGQGSIGAMLVFDNGLVVDWNYGLSPQLGIKLELGLEGGYDLGIKYELSKTMAIAGGVIGENNDFYIGIIGSAYLANNVLGLVEVSVIAGPDVYFHYELGIKHNLNRQLSLRAGFCGFTGGGAGVTEGQIGILYFY